MIVNTDNRRSFLKTLILSVTGGLGLMSANKVAAKIQPQTIKSDKPVSQGYRETRHVKAYYQSARF